MSKRRLFISHSSQNAALTNDVADALRNAVGTHPGFEILVDAACLQPGAPWSNQLDAMMAYAHAGLLLVTPEAIRRPDWIRKEAYILSWRQSLDPKFQLFIALLGGVDAQDLEVPALAPAQLNAIQRLKATDAAAIGAEIRAAAPPGDAETPFEQLTLNLALHLKLDPLALESLTKTLDAPQIPWLPAGQTAGIARIAARILTGELGTGNNLGDLIKLLKGFGVPAESLKLVLRWVAPFWVPPQSAGRLATVIRHLWDEKRDAWATINGQHVFKYTAKIFVEKVLPLNFACRVAAIETSATNPDVDYYTTAICKWLRDDDRSRPSDEQLGYPDDDTALAQQLTGERPFLVVPIEAPDPQTLSDLRGRFPNVMFLLRTGPVRPLYSTLPVVGLDVPEPIEDAEYTNWKDARRALQR